MPAVLCRARHVTLTIGVAALSVAGTRHRREFLGEAPGPFSEPLRGEYEPRRTVRKDLRLDEAQADHIVKDALETSTRPIEKSDEIAGSRARHEIFPMEPVHDLEDFVDAFDVAHSDLLWRT